MKSVLSLFLVGTGILLATGCGDKSDKPTVTMPTAGGTPKPVNAGGNKMEKVTTEKLEAPAP